MSMIATLGCLGVSLAAVTALAATDPKRRRAFRMPPLAAAPDRRLLWTAALVPGAGAAWFGGGGGFVLWFGAASVVGWGLAALHPERMEKVAQRLSAAAVRGPRPQRAPASAAASVLETRLAALETEVATLRRRLAEAQPPALDHHRSVEPAARLEPPTALRAGRVA